ncbi:MULTISPECIES: helix-turn-helix transcriptional regulator [Porcipelethomonas]|jgi:transcriptional regulator with XRE-family HTH domain|uniref:helix-turn-helix domain-containing protein n=1 Tax=Porcipelethomonas TaxID=2981643 RepID=UPI0008212B8E|nr:helix-turn-helix transcriptional regulator [Porcipelethomonas ammoniilytica]MBS6314368.1 helix-turn-helix transcriptional regulator [Ruminococcus sp.]MCU6718775.1 helix-turn-helix domain-containing protein [Porcipelethomonas ammoniilytica]SCI60329.1 Helix-turn-helix domain [uncultured Ruminococcus sp.]
MNNFGTRLRKVRLDKGITMEKLAELADTTEIAIRSYEKSRRYPNSVMLIKLCNALKVTPNYLLQDEIKYNLIEDRNEIIETIDGLTPKQLEFTKNMLVHVKDI